MDKVNLLTTIPHIKNRKQLDDYLEKPFVMERYFIDTNTYKDFQTQLYNLVKGCYPIRQCREYPVSFKFRESDKTEYKLELRHFMINVFAWYPFTRLEGDYDELDESFILDCYNDIPNINKYINEKLIQTLRDRHVKSTKINHAISEVLFNLRSISTDFSVMLGLSFSAATFIELYKNNPEMKEIMDCTFDDDMQPYQIEAKVSDFQAREVALLKSIKDNPLGIILRSGTGIKHKQLAEFTIAEALKPDMDGKTIPIPIEESTMIGGLNKPHSLYIDAMGARKSSVTNKKVMGKAGYFGKIVLLLTRTLTMSTRVSDCGTKTLVNYDVKNKKILQKLNGKFYKLNEYDSFKVIDGEKDTHLIGKTVMVRSVATCACENECCTKCVGMTAGTNFDIADGIAAFESEEITKVINQSILSTKHLLTTSSEMIEFNPEFYKFFTLSSSEIYPIVNNNEEIKDIENYAIYIDPNDMTKVEEMDDDSLFNTQIYNGRFWIRNLAKPDEPDIEIKIDGEKEIYVDNSVIEMIQRSKDGLVHFGDLSDDNKLFEITIDNNELTKPLYQLMDLLNKERKDGEVETIDSMSNKFVELLVDAGIDANIIAAEMIINRLIRSSYNIYKRPDFMNPYLLPTDYQIITVSKALEKNPSALIGLSFQNIKRQILSEDFFEERTESSYIDPFFKKSIPTKNFKKYSKLMKEHPEEDD